MYRKVSIFKSPDPKRHRCPWLARWRHAGKHSQRSFPTKTLAQAFKTKKEQEINDEFFQTIRALRWSQLEELFIASKKVDKATPDTIYNYEKVFSDFSRFLNGTPTTRITVTHIDAYKASISSGSASTVNKKLRHLSAILEWAVRRSYAVRNPVKSIRMMKAPKRQPVFLSKDQFQQLLSVCTGEYLQWKILILLAINGIARKNSIAQLKRSDIDLNALTICCYDRKQKTERVTPLHPYIAGELKSYIDTIPADQETLFNCKFHHTTWHRLLDRAGLPRCKFHHLRTSMVTWLKTAGVSDGVATAILGHSDPSVTTKYYTQLDNVEIKRKAIDKLFI